MGGQWRPDAQGPCAHAAAFPAEGRLQPRRQRGLGGSCRAAAGRGGGRRLLLQRHRCEGVPSAVWLASMWHASKTFSPTHSRHCAHYYCFAWARAQVPGLLIDFQTLMRIVTDLTPACAHCLQRPCCPTARSAPQRNLRVRPARAGSPFLTTRRTGAPPRSPMPAAAGQETPPCALGPGRSSSTAMRESPS